MVRQIRMNPDGELNNFGRDGLLREVEVRVPNGRNVAEIRTRDVRDVMYVVVIIVRRDGINPMYRDGI